MKQRLSIFCLWIDVAGYFRLMLALLIFTSTQGLRAFKPLTLLIQSELLLVASFWINVIPTSCSELIRAKVTTASFPVRRHNKG